MKNQLVYALGGIVFLRNILRTSERCVISYAMRYKNTRFSVNQQNKLMENRKKVKISQPVA